MTSYKYPHSTRTPAHTHTRLQDCLDLRLFILFKLLPIYLYFSDFCCFLLTLSVHFWSNCLLLSVLTLPSAPSIFFPFYTLITLTNLFNQRTDMGSYLGLNFDEVWPCNLSSSGWYLAFSWRPLPQQPGGMAMNTGSWTRWPPGKTCLLQPFHAHSSQCFLSFTLAAVQLITSVYACTLTTPRVRSAINFLSLSLSHTRRQKVSKLQEA